MMDALDRLDAYAYACDPRATRLGRPAKVPVRTLPPEPALRRMTAVERRELIRARLSVTTISK